MPTRSLRRTFRNLRLAALAFAVAVVGLAAPAGTVAGGGGCHAIPEAPPEGWKGTSVALDHHCFSPSVIHVVPGEEIIFANLDPQPHIITGVAASWGTNGDLRQGDTFTISFDEPGVYAYSCMYHYGMSGAVVVEKLTLNQEEAAAAPSDGGDSRLNWRAGLGLAAAGGLALGLMVPMARRMRR